MTVLDKIFGKNWREDKREWHDLQKRVKALPKEYQEIYKAIQKYCYNTGLIGNDWQRFIELLELFETSSSDGLAVQNIVGNNVAEFCDVFFDKGQGYGDWLEKHRQTLNEYFAKR